MSAAANDLPLDTTSRNALEAEGLQYALVDTGAAGDTGDSGDTVDSAVHERWLQAAYRGFHFDAFSSEQVAQYRAGLAYARTIGVWDSTAAEPANPVATVASWRAPVSLGEGCAIEAWAISLVSVAATHRRRGIARALLEGELRSAHSAGLALAMLTVSESTIYGRWGFGPAAYAADYRIDTRGLQFTAPLPGGRVHRVSADGLRPLAPAIAKRAHARTAGEVPADDLHIDRSFALLARTAAQSLTLRCARYDDADGEPQGYVLYSVGENTGDFAAHTLTVEYLIAATDDAYVALWHYLLDQDLVSTVLAPLRPVDELLPWLISNPRAVQTTARRDHLWLRILDVPTALSARRFAHADTVLLRVTDPQGFTDGDWMLVTDADGCATVTVAPAAPAAFLDSLVDSPVDSSLDPTASSGGPAAVELGVEALSALILGGTPVEALRLAGRLRELSPGSASRLSSLVHTARAPHLSTWF